MSSLTSILAFAHGGGSLLPPKDAHIHVSDTLDAHGVFVLLQYAIKALQDARPVVWVSARADGPTHLAHIARKAGISLDTPHFVYIDATSFLDDSLVPLHEIIQQALPPPASHPDTQAGALVIIDSLSMLQWCLSGTPEHIYHTFVNWLRLLRQTCESLDTALLTLMQADACAAVSHRGTLDQSDERLFRYLLRTADVWVSVSELPSGRAAACDGECGMYALVRPMMARTSRPSDPIYPFLMERYIPAPTKFLYRILPDGTGPKQDDGTRAIVRVWSRGSGADVI